MVRIECVKPFAGLQRAAAEMARPLDEVTPWPDEDHELRHKGWIGRRLTRCCYSQLDAVAAIDNHILLLQADAPGACLPNHPEASDVSKPRLSLERPCMYKTQESKQTETAYMYTRTPEIRNAVALEAAARGPMAKRHINIQEVAFAHLQVVPAEDNRTLPTIRRTCPRHSSTDLSDMIYLEGRPDLKT